MGINHRCIIAAEKDAIIDIGDHTGCSGCSIWSFRSIKIGKRVRIGANVTIMDSDAHLDDPRSGMPNPIEIEDNAWIGAGSLILKGVTIGRNSFIGAGSVVTKSIPANVIAAGVPCRVIRQLSDEVVQQLELGR